jgi:hypothetical protein
MTLAQFGVNIKGARLDNTKEFKSIKLNTFYKSKGLNPNYRVTRSSKLLDPSINII